MNKWEKEKLRDRRDKNGKLAPVFKSSFTCYHEDHVKKEEKLKYEDQSTGTPRD